MATSCLPLMSVPLVTVMVWFLPKSAGDTAAGAADADGTSVMPSMAATATATSRFLTECGACILMFSSPWRKGCWLGRG